MKGIRLEQSSKRSRGGRSFYIKSQRAAERIDQIVAEKKILRQRIMVESETGEQREITQAEFIEKTGAVAEAMTPEMRNKTRKLLFAGKRITIGGVQFWIIKSAENPTEVIH
jgi:hypothetical protein